MTRTRGPWTVTGSRVVYENPWVRVEEDAVVAPSGKEGIFSTVHFGNGSIVVPLDENGNVYLAKEYRYGLDKTVIEAFAGGLNAGEEPLAGAKRELLEESGMTATRWTYLGGFSILSSKMSSVDHLFLAEGLSFGDQQLDETEAIEVVKIPFTEALAALARNEIQSMQTAALLYGIAHVLGERAIA